MLKITFKQAPLEMEIEMFLGLLDWDWGYKITDKYPEFLKIKKIKSEDERRIAIKEQIVKRKETLAEKLEDGQKEIEKAWRSKESAVFTALSEIIQEDWSEKEITAYISINPICPRFLDSWSFFVSYDHTQPEMVITHEILHFLYFKKFKKLFPEVSRENYESPHKEWLLSELVAVTVLNDQRIKDILNKGNSKYYPEHEKLMVNGIPLTKAIEDLYKEFVLTQNDFSGFVRNGIILSNEQKQ